MTWYKYRLQKKQVSTDAGVTWTDVTPYETRRGSRLGAYNTYEECMNMQFRWIPTDFEYCDIAVDATMKASFGYYSDFYIPEDVRDLSGCMLTHEVIVKDGSLGDNAIYQNEVSEMKEGFIDVEVNEGIRDIKTLAFSDYSALTSVTLSSTVSRIETWAFQNCPNLVRFIVNAETPPVLGEEIFRNSPNVIIYVPDECLRQYKTASGWQYYEDKIKPISEITV